MRSRTALLAVLATAAATTFTATADAHAACTSAQGASYSYGDGYEDGGGAPEVDTVRVELQGSCALVVDAGITGPLGDGDVAFVYIDTDGNAATGDPLLGGADVTVGTIGADDGQSAPIKGTWDGDTFAFDDADAVGPNVGNGGFRTTVDALGIPSGVTAHFTVVSLRDDGGTVRTDVAPNTGTIPLRVSYSTTPLPVITPRQPTPRPTPIRRTPVVSVAPKPAGCLIPRTKSLTVAQARARLRAQGCRVVTAPRRVFSTGVRRGRVVGTSTAAGRRTVAPVRLVVSKGRKPRR